MGKIFASDEQLLKKVAYAKRMRRWELLAEKNGD